MSSLEDSEIKESIDITHRTIPQSIGFRQSFRSLGSIRESIRESVRESIDESIAQEVASDSHYYFHPSEDEIEEDIYKSISPSKQEVSESIGQFIVLESSKLKRPKEKQSEIQKFARQKIVYLLNKRRLERKGFYKEGWDKKPFFPSKVVNSVAQNLEKKLKEKELGKEEKKEHRCNYCEGVKLREVQFPFKKFKEMADYTLKIREAEWEAKAQKQRQQDLKTLQERTKYIEATHMVSTHLALLRRNLRQKQNKSEHN